MNPEFNPQSEKPLVMVYSCDPSFGLIEMGVLWILLEGSEPRQGPLGPSEGPNLNKQGGRHLKNDT